MNEFTASNGIAVESRDGALISKWPNTHDHLFISVSDTEALREFFRAEEDERLGRWRWPENPDYIVYDEGNLICVTQERTGHGNVIGRGWYEDHKGGLLAKEQPGIYAAAGAFFDAHPEPKPWHDAKKGECWLLTVDGEEFLALRDGDDDFYSTQDGYRVIRYNREGITAGRRIWPES